MTVKAHESVLGAKPFIEIPLFWKKKAPARGHQTRPLMTAHIVIFHVCPRLSPVCVVCGPLLKLCFPNRTGLNVGCFYAASTLLNRMIIQHYPVSPAHVPVRRYACKYTARGCVLLQRFSRIDFQLRPSPITQFSSGFLTDQRFHLVSPFILIHLNPRPPMLKHVKP